MDVVETDEASENVTPPAWVRALTEWIKQDVHPRFIIAPNLDCLWINDAAQRMMGERPPSGQPPQTLMFFEQQRLRALLQEAQDDLVHWSLVPVQTGEKLIVWAKAIGNHHNRLFGLVLMAPDHEQNFQDFFENARLTPAEARIIDAILRGETLAATAAVSGVSKLTIKTQLRNAYRKLNVSSRGELFAEARKFLAP